MDSFEINKIVAAVLMVALLVIGIGKLSDVIFYVEKPETPGYSVEVETATTVSTTSSSTSSDKIDISALMAREISRTVKKYLKNVQLVIQLLKEGRMLLVQHYIMLWVEKLERLKIINILKL